MGKIYSINMLALKQDVTEEAFERFVREEWNPNFVPPPSVPGYLLIGVKGDRQGRYLWIGEFESRDAGERAEADGMWQKQPGNQALIDKWYTFDNGFGSIFTDYEVIE